MSIDFESVLNSTKSSFTRERTSVINEYLNSNTSDIIISLVFKKTRGISVKFYHYKNGAILHKDYVLKNALVLLKALQHNNLNIMLHNDGKIVKYDMDVLNSIIESKQESKAKA